MTPLLSNMSPDDMRIAMALLDGRKPKRMWRVFFDKERQSGSVCILTHEEALQSLKHETENSKRYGWNTSEFSEPEEYDEWEDAPRYLNSLDAVAPVEVRLTADEHYQFRCHLWRITESKDLEGHNRDYISATALQRTKAILLATGKARL